MVYPKNTPGVSNLPDLFHAAKTRLAEAEAEVDALRERLLALHAPVVIGRRYRVEIDSREWKTLDKGRLRLFMSDKMIKDCMRVSPRTFVRLKTLSGKSIGMGRGKGRYRPGCGDDDE